MARPTKAPKWAEVYSEETVGNNVFPNKLEPADDLKQTGTLYKAPWGRAWLNWILDNLAGWSKHHEALIYPLGSVVGFENGVNGITTDPATLPADLIAARTWDYVGQQTYNDGSTNTTVNYYRVTGVN